MLSDKQKLIPKELTELAVTYAEDVSDTELSRESNTKFEYSSDAPELQTTKISELELQFDEIFSLGNVRK